MLPSMAEEINKGDCINFVKHYLEKSTQGVKSQEYTKLSSSSNVIKRLNPNSNQSYDKGSKKGYYNKISKNAEKAVKYRK